VERTSRRSSGSRRAESAVEPTRSENMTVTWRRSAVSWGFGAAKTGSWADGAVPPSSRIARRILRRSPRATPIFSKSRSVNSGRTETSMRFSAKRWAYSDMPSFSSQSARSCIAPHPQRRSLGTTIPDRRTDENRQLSLGHAHLEGSTIWSRGGENVVGRYGSADALEFKFPNRLDSDGI